MPSKLFLNSAILTLLSCIPLYVLSTIEYQLMMAHVPLFGLSLFIVIIIAMYWSRTLISQASGAGLFKARSGTTRESGSVKWFNANKGFGFITRDSGDDIFVHFRSIRGKGHRVLRDGQRVQFVVSEGDKGLQAEDVEAAS